MTNYVVTINNARHVVWECQSCGCVSTCPEVLWDQQYREGGYHHCPNGHSWGWNGQSCEREKLRRERDRLAQRVAEKDDEIRYQREQREATERRLTATRGVVTRIKNRVGHGVCPCCTRSFGNLARHMANQHPDYAQEKLEAAE